MSNSSNDGRGLVILFFGTWYMLSYSRFSDYAFVTTWVFFGVGWLGIRMLGSATARHGMKAWLLIVHLGVWYGLFLWLFPADLSVQLFILWGIATPLMLAGGVARIIRERYPDFRGQLMALARVLVALAIVVQLFLLWRDGFDLRNIITGSFLFSVLGSVPLYYGWRLAEPLPQGERDARFGSEDFYREAGMSDER